MYTSTIMYMYTQTYRHMYMHAKNPAETSKAGTALKVSLHVYRAEGVAPSRDQSRIPSCIWQ